MDPNSMAPTSIHWNGSVYVVAFHYDENKLMVDVSPPNANLEALLRQRIMDGTLEFYKGFNGPELR